MNCSILVVDDDPMVLTVTVRILQRLGYQVISCSSAEQALTLRHSVMDSVHLLLSDVNMPQQNGLELAQSLVEHHPSLRVLFMSGARHNNDGQKAILDTIQSRNWQVIAKPFTMETLQVTVKEVLGENQIAYCGRRRNAGM